MIKKVFFRSSSKKNSKKHFSKIAFGVNNLNICNIESLSQLDLKVRRFEYFINTHNIYINIWVHLRYSCIWSTTKACRMLLTTNRRSFYSRSITFKPIGFVARNKRTGGFKWPRSSSNRRRRRRREKSTSWKCQSTNRFASIWTLKRRKNWDVFSSSFA